MLLRVLSAFILVFITAPIQAFQIDMEAVFPNVAQGHRGNNNNTCHEVKKGYSYRPQLQMNNNAKISGTKGEKLDFCSSNIGAGLPTNSCDDGQGGWKSCEITEQDIRGVHNNGYNKFLKSSRSIIEKSYCSSKDKISYTGSANENLGKFSLYASCTLELDAEGNDYKVKSLAMGSGAKLILHTGDYWFEKLSLNQKAQVEIVGDVRIFIKNNAEFNSATVASVDSPAELIFSYGELHLTGTSEVNALVYSDEKVIMNDNSVINGRVTAKKLEMNTNAAINDAGSGGDDNTPAPGPKCFVDNFNRKNLKAEGDKKWVVKSKGENPFDPVIVDNRFRLTENNTKQSTAISYIGDKFPANNNKLVIEFDHYAYGGSGADGIALVLSDGDITPQPGAFGGPLGYGYRNKSNPGFAGGWLGIGIDEYGNFTNEGGSGSTGQHSHTVAIRGSGTGNSGFHLLKEANSTTSIDGYNKVCVKWWPWNSCRRYEDQLRAHRYQITFDSTTAGKALITVKRNTNPDTSVSGSAESSFDEILINSFDVLNNDTQSDLPETLVFSITGSTGDLTNFHEIDRAKICANKTEEFNAKVDHFRFSFANNNAQACQAQNLTLTACDDSNCNNYFSQPVTVNLAEQDGMTWVGGSSVTFTGSTSLRLISTIEKPVLDVIGSVPGTFPWSTTLCKVGTNNYSTNCTLKFSNALTKFKLDFPNGNAAYAGEAFPVVLKPQQNCRPLFAGEAHEISLSAEPVEPEQPALSPPVMLEYNNLDRSLAVNGSPETFKVTFNDAGEATFNLTYPEAGKTQLNVFEGDIEGSGQFVTVPKALCVSTESTGIGNDYKNYAPFKAAGADFDIKVSAHASKSNTKYCDAPVLQNYIHLLSINSELLAPMGGIPGKLKEPTYTHGQAGGINDIKGGINELIQSIDEVGVFKLSVTPIGAYHGTNLPIKSIPITVGRFYPDRFMLDSGEVKSKNVGTDTESYMDQPFDVNFTVSAVNAGGYITQNYRDEFAKGKVRLNALDGSKNFDSRLEPIFTNPMQKWTNGQLSFPSVNNSGHVTFTRNSTKQDGPYDLDFMLTLSDNDRPNIAQFDDTRGSNSSYSCGENCKANTLILGKQTVRHGRIVAPTVAGPVNEALSVPLRIEYWDTAKDNWQVFAEDNWTTLTMTDKVSFPENDYVHPTLTVNDQVAVEAGLDDGEGSGTHSSATMVDGQLNLNVGAPGVASTIKYQLNLNGLPWLKPLGDAANEGQIRFGNSPGNSSVIYRREQ